MVYSVNNKYDKNNITNCCPDGEMVDTRDLKSLDQKWLYEFDSRSGH